MKQKYFKKINACLSGFCHDLAVHAFLSFLVLVLIALLVGGLLFYQCSFSQLKSAPEVTGKIIQFKEGLYQKVLEEWQDREQSFEQADLKEYPNLFK